MNEINENDYMQDAKGRLIPKSMVKPQDQLRDQTVKIIVERFKKSHEVLKDCKVIVYYWTIIIKEADSDEAVENMERIVNKLNQSHTIFHFNDKREKA